MAKQPVPLLTMPQKLEVEQWCRKGLSLASIATLLGVDLNTFYAMMNHDSSLRDAICLGKAEGERDVANAMYDMATSRKDAGASRFYLERAVGSHWAPRSSVPVINVVPLSVNDEEMMRSMSERFRRQTLMLDGRIDENGDVIEDKDDISNLQIKQSE